MQKRVMQNKIEKEKQMLKSLYIKAKQLSKTPDSKNARDMSYQTMKNIETSWKNYGWSLSELTLENELEILYGKI